MTSWLRKLATIVLLVSGMIGIAGFPSDLKAALDFLPEERIRDVTVSQIVGLFLLILAAMFIFDLSPKRIIKHFGRDNGIEVTLRVSQAMRPAGPSADIWKQRFEGQLSAYFDFRRVNGAFDGLRSDSPWLETHLMMRNLLPEAVTFIGFESATGTVDGDQIAPSLIPLESGPVVVNPIGTAIIKVRLSINDSLYEYIRAHRATTWNYRVAFKVKVFDTVHTVEKAIIFESIIEPVYLRTPDLPEENRGSGFRPVHRL